MNPFLPMVLTATLTGCCHIPPDSGKPGVSVVAKAKYTAIGRVQAGKAYVVTARGEWRDWVICTDARGFDSTWVMRWGEARRRHPEARWFALVGVITATTTPPEDDQHALVKPIDLSPYLAPGVPWISPASGTLFVFANDMPSMYWNNHGEIRVQLDPTTGEPLTP